MLKRLVLIFVSLMLTGLIWAGIGVVVGWTWLDREVDRIAAELKPKVDALRQFTLTRPGWAFPSEVYTDWFDLSVGDGYGVERVAREAKARGYRKVDADAPLQPGEFAVTGKSELTVALRGFDFPDGKVGPVTVRLKAEKAKLTAVEKVSGDAWPCPYRIEPLYMDTWIPDSNEIRTFTPLAQIPPIVQQAILASEDARFREHKGVDHIGILRAIRRNVLEQAPVQGASTLTQQVVRTFFLTRERSYRRKLNEALRALALERIISKDDVLELYLNSVYLGQVNGRSIGGVAAGARWFFDKNLSEVTPDEAALFAAVVPAPVTFSPFRNPEVTRKRREHVLDRMAEVGFLPRDTAEALKSKPIVLHTPLLPAGRWPLWSQWARRDLTEAFAQAPGGALGDPAARGLRVFTSLDPALQTEAEAGLAQSVGELEADFGVWRRDPLQGASFGLDPQTALALFAVPGRGVAGDQFNRAVQAKRSPGSTIKPVAYAAVLSQKDAQGHFLKTPADTVSDEHRSFDTPEGKWSPRNSDGLYHPWVTIAKAFAKSMNVATTNLVVEAGPDKVVAMAKSLGMTTDFRAVPSVGLGSSEITMNELVGALSTVAVDGKRIDVSASHRAFDRTGKLIWEAPAPKEQAMDPRVAGMVQTLMRNSYERGTGFKARIELGSARDVVGKTGTSQSGRDLWFVGVAKNLAIAFWVGHDKGHPIWEIAGDTIAPAWGRMVRPLYNDLEKVPFTLPAGLELVYIDPYSGCRGGPFPVAMPVDQPFPKCRPIDWEIPVKPADDDPDQPKGPPGDGADAP